LVHMKRIRVRPVFEWRDMWVGVYYSPGELDVPEQGVLERQSDKLYVMLLPMLGFVVEWGGDEWW